MALLGSAPAEAHFDTGLADELRFGLSAIRRSKDPVELERMRAAQLRDACRLCRCGADDEGRGE